MFCTLIDRRSHQDKLLFNIVIIREYNNILNYIMCNIGSLVDFIDTHTHTHNQIELSKFDTYKRTKQKRSEPLLSSLWVHFIAIETICNVQYMSPTPPSKPSKQSTSCTHTIGVLRKSTTSLMIELLLIYIYKSSF